MGLIGIAEPYRTIALVGAKGTGKTPFALGDDQYNVPSFVKNVTRKYNMRALFVDMQVERNHYEKIKTANWRKLISWRGAVRIIPKAEERDECLQWIRDNVRECYVVFEDAGNIFPERIRNTPFEGFLIDCKNHKCGAMLMFHDYMMIPRGAFTLINDLEIFHNGSHPSIRGNRIIPNYRAVLETHERVQRSKNHYYHETVTINN